MRRAARTDKNHADVMKAFRKAGFSVHDTSRLGGGFGDCVVARNMHTAIIEIKDGSKPPSARKLTADEKRFLEGWRGAYYIIESVDDVIALSRHWPNHSLLGFLL